MFFDGVGDITVVATKSTISKGVGFVGVHYLAPEHSFPGTNSGGGGRGGHGDHLTSPRVEYLQSNELYIVRRYANSNVQTLFA